MRAPAVDQIDQLVRLVGPVIHAIEHAVLEGDEVARRTRQVVVAGLHQVGQVMFAVQGHQRTAQVVVRGMQRHGQRHRAVFAQAVDQPRHARGGHGDPPP